jgi:wobble nucleotide-excising tRNase
MELKASQSCIEEIIDVITKANTIIDDYNLLISKREESIKTIKNIFWNMMRWEYDQTISNYNLHEKTYNSMEKSIATELENITTNIDKQRKIISIEQKNIVNIDEAIENINKGLIDIGITDFKIIKHSEDTYMISRETEQGQSIFKSLSEGEKMVISFLYFVELCRGKSSATSRDKEKIIVIDDPISSLSHIYIFNIGRIIQYEFLRSEKYKQIFILTHSLYFFYELTDTNKERRELNQKLFRLRKNNNGTQIIEMKYEEIQNDYHSYWFIVKDKNQPAALIANCMRNIIDYFFNFVEKKDLNCVFQKPSLQNFKFQAFNRYINRESHSVGQNIFDIKEFDYDSFKEAFRLIFYETDYIDHYEKMMNL